MKKKCLRFLVDLQSHKISLLIFGIFSVHTANVYSQKINGKAASKILGTISLTVKVSDITSEVFDASTQLIYNGAVTMSASGGNGPYTYSITTGYGTYHISNGYFALLNPGSYPLSVTDANGQTVDTTIVVGFVYPQPSVNVSNIVNPNSCDGQNASFILTGSGGTPPYTYSIDGGNNFTANGNFTGLAQGIYPILIMDANGQIAQIGTNPSSPYIPGDINLYCSACGCTANVNASMTACTIPWWMKIVTYSYLPTDSFSLDGKNFKQLIPNIAYPNVYYYDTTGYGPGLYKVYVKDGLSGALTITAVPISKYCNIDITFVSVDAACHLSNGTLTVTAKNGTPPYTYTIDGVNYQTSNVFSGLAAGSYYVTAKDASGGSNSQETFILDNCPTVTATETDETCGQLNGSITATGVGGTTPYRFSIDGTNFQTGNGFSGLPSGDYIVTVQDANKFTGTTSISIKNNCLQVSATITNPTCSNNNGSILASGSGGLAPYQFSVDGLNFIKGNEFDNLIGGTYTITIKDAKGVTANTTVELSNTALPTINIATSQASCNNTKGSIQINPAGGATPFQYSMDNGNTFQTGNVFTGLDSGQYIILTKDANGCTSSSSVYLTALVSPVFSLGNDTTLCNGKSILLSIPPSAGNQYLWQDNSVTNSYLVTTAGIYSLKITNQSGCSVTKSVKVNYSPPPVFSLGRDTVLCDVEPLTLQPSPLVPGNYLWNTGSQETSLPVSTSGTYDLTISDHGCPAQQWVHVTFKPTPMFNLGADTTLCEGQSLFFDVTTANSVYTWQDGSSGPTYTVSKPGNYSVQVDENGCGTASAVIVSYDSRPVLKSWTDTSVCVSQKILLDASYPQSTYLWQDGSTTPTFSVKQDGVYSVSVTNTCGTATNTIKVSSVQCDCHFFVPNAFTPNRDGHNDLFFANDQCLFSDYEMKIYNRWGQMVFSSGNISAGWDGEMGGRPQPVGVYVWMISYRDGLTGKTMSKNGTVMLIR